MRVHNHYDINHAVDLLDVLEGGGGLLPDGGEVEQVPDDLLLVQGSWQVRCVEMYP